MTIKETNNDNPYGMVYYNQGPSQTVDVDQPDVNNVEKGLKELVEVILAEE